VKLDSAPLNLSHLSEAESQLEVQQDKDYRSVTALVDIPPSLVVDESPKPQKAIVVFATTFVTIFLAEIGDKTQLSTLLISAESQSPWVVFLGSASALVITSLLGVLLGSWMASRLSPKTIEKASGIMLLFISIMLFWDLLIQ
jgi:putative Ca2+/H+ antiporter (TMEM165/GDT1 family)